MVARATEVTARLGAECFDRPFGTESSFLLDFPALRTGLLSLSPSGTKVLTVQSWPLSWRVCQQPPDRYQTKRLRGPFDLCGQNRR